MDSDDKKTKTIIKQAFKEVVLPRLDKIEKKLDATMEMTAKNSEDITIIKEDFTDMGYTVERIETKLDATIRRQDDASVKNSQLARRVLKLETAVKK